MPSESPLQLSIMALDVPSPEQLARIAELGMGIEVNNLVLPDRSWREDYETIARDWALVLRSFSGIRSMHGAFWHLHPASSEPEVVEFARKRHRQSIEAAAIVGCQYLVLHSDVHARRRPLGPRDDWTLRLTEHFKELARQAASHGVTVVIENTFESDPRTLADLACAIAAPNVGLSLDVGHAHLSADRPLDDWVWRMQPYLRHMHLHDNDGAYDRHWPLGRGVLNFGPLFQAAAAVERPPLIVLEVGDEAGNWDGVETVIREGWYRPPRRVGTANT